MEGVEMVLSVMVTASISPFVEVPQQDKNRKKNVQ
jgi:hypothetical protein